MSRCLLSRYLGQDIGPYRFSSLAAVREAPPPAPVPVPHSRGRQSTAAPYMTNVWALPQELALASGCHSPPYIALPHIIMQHSTMPYNHMQYSTISSSSRPTTSHTPMLRTYTISCITVQYHIITCIPVTRITVQYHTRTCAARRLGSVSCAACP